MIPRTSILLLALLAGCAGGDPDADCDTVCAKNAECRKESPGKDACVAECRELAKDEAYADALATQAECYASADCNQLLAGACTAANVE